ncbi:transcriptional regulator with XRE-family HTH domain [Marmoricola sp. URHA0025 HA25]
MVGREGARTVEFASVARAWPRYDPAVTASLDPAALREARQKAGLTQGQVARALGLAGGEAVSVWERGAFEPKSAALLHRLAEVLGATVPELLRCDDGNPDLRYLRLVAGLESADVADQLHVAVSTYRRWERGAWTRSPSDAVIASLAQAFRVPAGAVARALAHTKAHSA